MFFLGHRGPVGADPDQDRGGRARATAQPMRASGLAYTEPRVLGRRGGGAARTAQTAFGGTASLQAGSLPKPEHQQQQRQREHQHEHTHRHRQRGSAVLPGFGPAHFAQPGPASSFSALSGSTSTEPVSSGASTDLHGSTGLLCSGSSTSSGTSGTNRSASSAPSAVGRFAAGKERGVASGDDIAHSSGGSSNTGTASGGGSGTSSGGGGGSSGGGSTSSGRLFNDAANTAAAPRRYLTARGLPAQSPLLPPDALPPPGI